MIEGRHRRTIERDSSRETEVKTKNRGAALALLCVMAGATQAQDLPKWLTDAKAREVRLAEPIDVASADGWLRTKVHGALKQEIVQNDGAYDISIALGEDVTVSCVVLRGSRDLAALLERTAKASLEGANEERGTVEARVVEASDAGSVGPNPYMSLQWLYRVDLKGEKRVGALKQYAAALDDAVVFCAHDDLGYSRTFEAVTRTLTTHLRTGGEPAPRPYFREVSVVSLDGTRVGVATTTMTKDADGDTKVVNASALLLQTAPGQLVAQDVSDVQWVRPDGTLINAVQVKSSNGAMSEDMALKQQDGEGDGEHRWKVSGTISGKQIDVELQGAPSSYVAQAKARRALMAQASPVGASTDALTWTSLDLTRLLSARSTVLAPVGTDHYAVREEVGGVAIEAVLDKQTGTMVSAKMPLGPRTMNFERLYRHGDF
jgi:hypothetical protein